MYVTVIFACTQGEICLIGQPICYFIFLVSENGLSEHCDNILWSILSNIEYKIAFLESTKPVYSEHKTKYE